MNNITQLTLFLIAKSLNLLKGQFLIAEDGTKFPMPWS